MSPAKLSVQTKERMRVQVDASEPRDYDAFISYNRRVDTVAASKLQRLIRRVGRPWYQRRSLRIFRDKTNLLMSESLWGSIEDALERSHHFVLMASPEAAESTWVRREVDYWRRNRNMSMFFIVHTGGQIEWDERKRDFDWDRTDALPKEVSGWFTDAPNWGTVTVPVDERQPRRRRDELLRDVALTIAASLYGVDKDELHNEDERELRKARIFRRGGIAALAMLTVVAVVAAGIAFRKGGEATAQEQIALSHKLASASENQLATNLDVANLLAVKAFRTDPNPQTRAALFRAVSASGSLVRYLPFDAPVSKLAASADGSAVVVGLEDGRVQRWRLADRAPEQVLDLDAEVQGLSVSGNGDVVVATDQSTAKLARRDREAEALSVPTGWNVGAVAVSPSGRTAVVSSSEDTFQGRMAVSVLRIDGDNVRRTDHQGSEQSLSTASVAVTSDDEALLLNGGHGSWERTRLADWSLLSGSSTSFGNHNYGVTASADGRAISYTNGDETISVWRTDRPTDIESPDLTARAPIALPGAITLSADASSLAIAEDSAIYVSRVLPAGGVHAEPVRLNGTGRVTTDGLRFLGVDGKKLVSASGNRVTLWDLDQTDRIGGSFPLSLSPGCNACGPPDVVVSQDGSRMIAINGSGSEGVAGPLARPDEIRPLPDVKLSAGYGPAVWDPDGSRATLVVQPPVGGTWAPVPRGMPDYIHAVSAGQRAEGVEAAALSSDARQLIVVQLDGGIDLIDLAKGTTRMVLPDPAAPVAPKAPRVRVAAVSSTANLTAVADEESIVIRDALTGVVVGETKRTEVRYLGFVPGRLLVQRESGELEIWDERLTGARATIAGDPGFVWPPVSNGTLVARARANGAIVVVDLATGSLVANIAAGAPGRRVGIAFSGNGSRLVMLTEGDGVAPATVVYRDIADETMVRTACTTAGRDLTADEWHALVDAPVPADLRCQ